MAKMRHNLNRSVEVAKKEANYVLYKYSDLGKAMALLPDVVSQRKAQRNVLSKIEQRLKIQDRMQATKHHEKFRNLKKVFPAR